MLSLCHHSTRLRSMDHMDQRSLLKIYSVWKDGPRARARGGNREQRLVPQCHAWLPPPTNPRTQPAYLRAVSWVSILSLCACASLAHDNSNAANPTGITMSAIIFNWAAHYRSENPQVYKYNVSITTGFPFLFLPQPSPLHTYFCIPPVSLITLL